MATEPDFRFPKSYRLLTKADYAQVFAEGTRVRDRYFTVLYRKNGLAHPRLGLAVSRKQLPKAVQRNRIKRIVRESFRHNKRLLGSTDLVIMVRSDTSRIDNKTLFDALLKLWNKVAVRQKEKGSCECRN